MGQIPYYKYKVHEEIQSQDRPEGTGEPLVFQKSWGTEVREGKVEGGSWGSKGRPDLSYCIICAAEFKLEYEDNQ